MRARAAGLLWLTAVAALVFDILERRSFFGITIAVVCLVLLGWSTLWVLKRLKNRSALRSWSLVINGVEIVAYTAIIHFSGGIEAAYLTLIYAALIAYLGILGRERLPLLVAGISSLAFGLMVLAEQQGWIGHWPLLAAADRPPIPGRTQAMTTIVIVCLLLSVAVLSSRAASMLWASKRRVRRSERQYRTLVENMPGLVYLSSPGLRTETIYLGGMVEALTGLTAEEIIDGDETLLDLCHPDDRSDVGSKIDVAIADRMEYLVAYRLRHTDGTWRWVEERGRPVFDAEGGLAFVEGLVLQINDRRLLEEEATLRRVMQQAAKEWQLTFDTVELPVLILDHTGRIRRLNRAARDLAGRSFTRCMGLRLGELGDDNPWSAAEELVSEVLETRGRGPRYRLTSSRDRHWDLTAILSPRFAEERIVLIVQEVTRIVELEDSLRRGEKLAAMGALVGGVAHEVRNPLFGISATLDAMRASLGPDAELQQYLAVLRSQVDRMTELMNGLLAYGRSAGSERSLGVLEEVIAKAVADCQPLAGEAGVEIVQDLDLFGRVLSMNRDGLVSLFTNLVANAVQHSPPGSRVRVEARGIGEGGENWIECVVRDSGLGFSEEALAKACEPFFTRRPGGMGLGLAICERIIEDHGGKLIIANCPGRGAEVTVRLPCRRGALRHDEIPAAIA